MRHLVDSILSGCGNEHRSLLSSTHCCDMFKWIDDTECHIPTYMMLPLPYSQIIIVDITQKFQIEVAILLPSPCRRILGELPIRRIYLTKAQYSLRFCVIKPCAHLMLVSPPETDPVNSFAGSGRGNRNNRVERVCEHKVVLSMQRGWVAYECWSKLNRGQYGS